MLSELFTSKSRAEILRILFDGLNREHYLRDLEKLTKIQVNSLQKELKHLSDLDILSFHKDGNRIYYSANPEHPLYEDLISIVKKTVGVNAKLSERLNTPSIKLAFIFGSFARGEERAASDVDLFIVGDIGMRGVAKLLSGLQEEIGREINPHVLTLEEFKKRITEKDHFLASVLKGKIELIKGSLGGIH